ncbi:MAG TPA: response regulator [Candidatus Angelobacter sp.]|jgi:DNA-binding response OmpR family regulator|nr:response regulator [Candidatus Angelobacter sp.]
MSGLKVLIAEDETISRKLLHASLTKWGCEVVSATNGEDACAALREGGIDLCILDWEMPNMTGPEVCQWLRSSDLDQSYVILLTTKGQPEDIEAGFDAGADDYMIKPFKGDALRNRISELAQRAPVADCSAVWGQLTA